MKVKFEFRKYTKNKVCFEEVTDSPLDTQKIGVQYIAKEALNILGWKEGEPLFITITKE